MAATSPAPAPSSIPPLEPALTSDSMNYMVWRYLQEAGYLEAALRLQRDWCSEPTALPVAHSIQAHHLVKLCHHGLLYRGVLKQLLDEPSRAAHPQRTGPVPFRWSVNRSKKQQSKSPGVLAHGLGVSGLTEIAPRTVSTESRSAATRPSSMGPSRRSDSHDAPEQEPARKRRKTSEPRDDAQAATSNGFSVNGSARPSPDETADQELDPDRTDTFDDLRRSPAALKPKIDQATQSEGNVRLDLGDRVAIIEAGPSADAVAWMPTAETKLVDRGEECLISTGHGSQNTIFNISKANDEHRVTVNRSPVPKHPGTGEPYDMVECRHSTRDGLVACARLDGDLMVMSKRHPTMFLQSPLAFLPIGLRWHPVRPYLLGFGTSLPDSSGRCYPMLAAWDLTCESDGPVRTASCRVTEEEGISIVMDATFVSDTGSWDDICVISKDLRYTISLNVKSWTIVERGPRSRYGAELQNIRSLAMPKPYAAIAISRSDGRVMVLTLQPSESGNDDQAPQGVAFCSQQASRIADHVWRLPAARTQYDQLSAELLVCVLEEGIKLFSVSWDVLDGRPVRLSVIQLKLLDCQIGRISRARLSMGTDRNGVQDGVSSLGVSHSGRYLAAGCPDSIVLFWDLESILKRRVGPDQPMPAAVFWEPSKKMDVTPREQIGSESVLWSPSDGLVSFKMHHVIALIPFTADLIPAAS